MNPYKDELKPKFEEMMLPYQNDMKAFDGITSKNKKEEKKGPKF